MENALAPCSYAFSLAEPATTSAENALTALAGLIVLLGLAAPAGLLGLQTMTPKPLRGRFIAVVTAVCFGVGPPSIGALSHRLFADGGIGLAIVVIVTVAALPGVSGALVGRCATGLFLFDRKVAGVVRQREALRTRRDGLEYVNLQVLRSGRILAGAPGNERLLAASDAVLFATTLPAPSFPTPTTSPLGNFRDAMLRPEDGAVGDREAEHMRGWVEDLNAKSSKA